MAYWLLLATFDPPDSGLVSVSPGGEALSGTYLQVLQPDLDFAAPLRLLIKSPDLITLKEELLHRPRIKS